MDIQAIKLALADSNPQQRMKGIRELRNYEAKIAAPLLLEHTQDQEFLVRSFVAMGLGRKQSQAGFNALLIMINNDSDPNVRAEAANSLSYYGEEAVEHLRKMYETDTHWLVRRSIIAAIADLGCSRELFEICKIGLAGSDQPVQESCFKALGLLAHTPQKLAAQEILLNSTQNQSWRIRLEVAKSLGQFKTPETVSALAQLKQDPDHRVVGAVLESMI